MELLLNVDNDEPPCFEELLLLDIDDEPPCFGAPIILTVCVCIALLSDIIISFAPLLEMEGQNGMDTKP